MKIEKGKLKKLLISIILIGTLFSCEDKYKEIPTYGDPTLIKVRVDIDAKAKFDRIELRTSYQKKLKDSYVFNKNIKRKYIFLKVPSGVEDVIQLFSIYRKDTIFSGQLYVEGGYRENFILLKDTLIHI